MIETMSSRARWVGLLFISIAVSLIIVDSTIVNVAIPSIVDDLGIDSTQVQWVQTSYTLVFAALLIPWMAFNLAGIVGGAIPPLVAGALVASLGSWAVGLMIAFFVVVSIVCTALLPETKGAALERDAAVAG